MITPLRKKTIIGWAIACIVFVGLLGYEWIPEYLRGGWIFYLLLVISGGFMQIDQALIVGIIAFIGSAVYLTYKLNLGLPAEKQALMMFLTPIAPLWLSAINHNLGLRQGASGLLVKFHLKSDLHVLNLNACADFARRMEAMCRRDGIHAYRVIDITIKNQDLIAEMLGEQVWQRARLQILAIFEESIDQALFHFANHEFSDFRCIDLEHSADSIEAPKFIQQLNKITELKLDINYSQHMIPAVESAA